LANRLIGRIDRVFPTRPGATQKPWGYLATDTWERYQWHSNDLEDKGQVTLEHGDIVSFEPEESETERCRQAKNIRLEKREPNLEVFGRLAKFMRERNQEVTQ